MPWFRSSGAPDPAPTPPDALGAPPAAANEAAPTAPASDFDLAGEAASKAPGASGSGSDSDALDTLGLPPEIEDAADARSTVSSSPAPPEVFASLPEGAVVGGDLFVHETLERGECHLYRADNGEYPPRHFLLLERPARGGDASSNHTAPQAQTLESEAPLESEVPALFLPARRFVSDGREYAAFDWVDLSRFDEWSPPPNDETLQRVALELARALLWLRRVGLAPRLSVDSLRVDRNGQPRHLGFFDPAASASTPAAENANAESVNAESENCVNANGEDAISSESADVEEADEVDEAVRVLASLVGRFAQHNLARGATLRLDDRFEALPLSRELKDLARRLDACEIGLANAVAELESLGGVGAARVALLCDVGMVREGNEDAGMTLRLAREGALLSGELDLIAVADGMGGHEGGEVASNRTLHALGAHLLAHMHLDWNDNAAVLDMVRAGTLAAHHAVQAMNLDAPYAGMRHKPGATLVWSLRVGSRLFVGNAGDSRAYRWSAARGLERITKDHSYVQELVDAGRLAPEAAWGHPQSSIITSHIGMAGELTHDTFVLLLSPGDRVFLVSDGIVDMVPEEDICAIVAQHETPELLCAALIDAANQAGGCDNSCVGALFCS